MRLAVRLFLNRLIINIYPDSNKNKFPIGNAMNFGTAIKTCLSKYATFNGRASRSEFWWFYLLGSTLYFGPAFAEILSFFLGFDGLGVAFDIATTLLYLGVFIPTFAAISRRLHDTGRSGWWQLLAFTIIGLPILIFWLVKKGENKTNKYGDCALT